MKDSEILACPALNTAADEQNLNTSAVDHRRRRSSRKVDVIDTTANVLFPLSLVKNVLLSNFSSSRPSIRRHFLSAAEIT